MSVEETNSAATLILREVNRRDGLLCDRQTKQAQVI